MSMSGFMQQLSQQSNINPPLSAAERAQRSVFVGNIPYEATEEQLKDIFAQAGPVVSFRLVYDRETGKPKGYGFCEYQDVETAQSSMRNLNNHDFNGRPLRVGVAAGDQNKDEMKGLQQAIGGPPIESPYGASMETEKAPEAISQAVASLPPEQMFDLMKQMKLCIQNNPNEARNMLLQNPQLAYALLQAQIVMKIVDPQVALAMLHRESNQIPPPIPTSGPPQGAPQQTGPPSGQMGIAGGPHPGVPAQRMPGYMGDHPREIVPGHIRDERPMEMMGAPRPMQGMAPRGPMPDMGGPYAGPRPDMHDPRMRDPHALSGRPGPSSLLHGGIPASLGSNLAAGLAQLPKPGTQISAQDQEKANLIMQVLQLTEEQIAMLPPEQRQSILILKDQISQSSH